MSAEEIVWVASKWLFPTDDGARRASYQLLRDFQVPGYKKTMVAFITSDDHCDIMEAKKKLGLENCYLINRPQFDSLWKRRVVQLLQWVRNPQLPITVASFGRAQSTLQFLEILQEISDQGRKPLLIIFDGMHGAAAFLNLIRLKKFYLGMVRIAYRAHNVESELWRQVILQKRLFFIRRFLKSQYKNIERFEKSLVELADLTFPVSEEDSKIFQTLYPKSDFQTLEIGVDFAPPQVNENLTLCRGPLEILFLGRLDWLPNRQGLEWFLNCVWPLLIQQRNDLRLNIVGSGSSQWLKPFLKLSQIHFFGRVDHLEDQYRRCALSIVPIFMGSGTRVKVIEASQHHRAVLSTRLGVQGLGLNAGETFLHAESPTEWIEHLLRLNLRDALSMGEAAHQSLKQRFESQTIGKRMNQILQLPST